jgi:hypothetical protein
VCLWGGGGGITEGCCGCEKTAEAQSKEDAERPEGGFNERDSHGAEDKACQTGCQLNGQSVPNCGPQHIQQEPCKAIYENGEMKA